MIASALFDYWLSASLYFAGAYGLYRLLFAEQRPFQRQRFILLGLLAWSLLLPLLPAMRTDVLAAYQLPAFDLPAQASLILDGSWSWSAVYVGGIFLALIFALVQVLLLSRLTRDALPLGSGTYLLRKSFQGGGFTFLQKIYLSPDADASLQSVILRHEEVHRRQWHSLDLILLRGVLLFGWFNPLFYLALRDLKSLHEYQADELSARHHPQHYAGALLACAFRVPLSSILHTFSSPHIQKRLTMLQQTQSKSRQTLRILALFPFLLFSLIAQVGCSQGTEELNIQADSRPEFRGGQAALVQFMQSEIHYPQQAREDKIQGMVVTRFIVDENGAVTEAQVLKGVDPQLDAEALRVVEAMPKWQAGRKAGKNIRAEFTLPIRFAL